MCVKGNLIYLNFKKAPYTTYNTTIHDCEFNEKEIAIAKLLNKPCKIDSDCGTTFSGCDTSPLGNQTNTCRGLYGVSCLSWNECVDDLPCENYKCVCV
jgi:hypothetical protein